MQSIRHVKLEAKGVASVRKRVTTVREHCDISLADFKAFARRHLCEGTIRLTPDDVEEIRAIEQGYYASDWIYGHRKRGRSTPMRVEGVGEFVIDLTVENGDALPRIGALDISGDFFITGDVDAAIVRPLTRCPLSASSMAAALSGTDMPSVIPEIGRAHV